MPAAQLSTLHCQHVAEFYWQKRVIVHRQGVRRLTGTHSRPYFDLLEADTVARHRARLAEYYRWRETLAFAPVVPLVHYVGKPERLGDAVERWRQLDHHVKMWRFETAYGLFRR